MIRSWGGRTRYVKNIFEGQTDNFKDFNHIIQMQSYTYIKIDHNY